MRYIIILIIVANQVITPVVSYNLVRIHDIQFFPLGMHLKVRSVGIINKADFLFLINGIVQGIQRVHGLLVVRVLQFRQVTNMLYLCRKMPPAKFFQLVNQFPGTLLGNAFVEQYAVNEKAKLRVVKFSSRQERAFVVRYNIETQLFQRINIVLHRTPVAFHSVLCPQMPDDFLLCQVMILVRILFQNIQDQHIQHFFISGCKHFVSALSLIIIIACCNFSCKTWEKLLILFILFSAIQAVCKMTGICFNIGNSFVTAIWSRR